MLFKLITHKVGLSLTLSPIFVVQVPICHNEVEKYFIDFK